MRLSPGALRAIESVDWPGNIRQLENAVEAAVIRALGDGATEAGSRHVFPESEVITGVDSNEPYTFQEATLHFQRELLCRVLEETEWNISETARRLDLARSHIYNLIARFGLRGEEGD